MGRRQTDSELGRCALLILFVMGMISCSFVYFCLSVLFRPLPNSNTHSLGSNVNRNGGDSIGDEEGEEECCRGIEHLELWGDAVRWGSDFKVNSSRECCMACKEMCGREGGSCLCDTWVFCGDREACGSRFGECWLKKQRDTLGPQLHGSGDKVIWTSGQVFGKTEGIIGLETEYGMLRVKLLPDCAPHSVIYILELLASRFCAGCRFYRAESRGDSWDSEGNRVGHDMEIADNIAQLPTKSEVFSNVPVSVLEKHVPLRFHRINTSP
ncbi:hypothetical protein HS088_TW17G00388 [Tripterygium wilfordii]|uniref:Uncharacterized protein n=1 Tax=Tripterygium wilfordii TaxID=458696 RepID=A0A7J7CFW8_TRIWF|nr:hypothetical protein HS088_TW17G00388 [Tripterygium wilfordii]